MLASTRPMRSERRKGSGTGTPAGKSKRIGRTVTTLLVLGSKPEPALPSLADVDEVACANASGRTALALGLPRPTLTVISSVITSGKNPSNRLALAALRGLSSRVVYVYPRPPYMGKLLKQLRHLPAILRTTPPMVRKILRRGDYHFDEIHFPSLSYYLDAVVAACGGDGEIAARVRRKVPSTGVVAIALALGDARYERVIVGGFSFEITHSYAENPEIQLRGSKASRHAETDILVLRRMAQHSPRLFTSEPIVHDLTGVPLWLPLPPLRRVEAAERAA